VNDKKQIREESEDLENIELTEEEIEIGAKRLWKLTDKERKEIIPNLTPMQKRFLRCMRKGGFENYRIIQEVISVKHCPRQAKVGGKIVYNAMGELRPDDCDAFPVTGYCTQAMMSMLLHSYLVSDRISGGIDPDPVGLNLVRCPNFDLAEGGLGSVLFKVYRIKVDQEST
jgi:hypothetical protein